MVNVLLSVFLLISYGHVFSSIDLPPDVMILFDDDFVVMNLTEVFFKNKASGKKYIIFRRIYIFSFTKLKKSGGT
jgi:hypothetical protein